MIIFEDIFHLSSTILIRNKLITMQLPMRMDYTYYYNMKKNIRKFLWDESHRRLQETISVIYESFPGLLTWKSMCGPSVKTIFHNMENV